MCILLQKTLAESLGFRQIKPCLRKANVGLKKVSTRFISESREESNFIAEEIRLVTFQRGLKKMKVT